MQVAIRGHPADSHSWVVLDGVGTLSPMREDNPTTETLRLEQLQREQAERECAQTAPTAAEEHAARRRADKAAYLRAKLDEQADHPDAPS